MIYLLINENFKDISAQIFSIFYDFSKFSSIYGSIHFEKSTNIEKKLGEENVFQFFI
jgi:hypothetical protein